MEQAVVTAVTHDDSDAKITVVGVPDRPGVAARLFRSLADRDVNVDMVVQNVSEHGATDISFTVPHDVLDDALEVCRIHAPELGAESVVADPDIAKVSIVGAGMKSHPGVTATMFEVLAAGDINIEMISTSAIRLTCVVRSDRAEDAVVLLHDAFVLEKPVPATS